MNCEKCLDRGFVDLDRGGITSQFCDCEVGQAFRKQKMAELGYPESEQTIGIAEEDAKAGEYFDLQGLNNDNWEEAIPPPDPPPPDKRPSDEPKKRKAANLRKRKRANSNLGSS